MTRVVRIVVSEGEEDSSDDLPYWGESESGESSERPPLSQEEEQLFEAVEENDLDKFQRLVKDFKSLSLRNWSGNTLLKCAIIDKRYEIFDYLLSLDNIDIEFPDDTGSSSLMSCIGGYFDEYFVQQLIKKGANLQCVNRGYTLLHAIASNPSDNNLQIGKMLIENGGNVNAEEGHDKETPLHVACREGYVDCIYMLLYYGALATIRNRKGFLPLEALSTLIPQEIRTNLEETLFHHTFDSYTETAELSTLVAAMLIKSSLFSEILGNISTVQYNIDDLLYFYHSLPYLQPRHFQLFMKTFNNIVKEMIVNGPSLIWILKSLAFGKSPYVMDKDRIEVLYNFLESDFMFGFIPRTDRQEMISLILRDNYEEVDEYCQRPNALEVNEDIEKCIYTMLSYGLHVYSRDLDFVYVYYGYCELFQNLLHMDITIIWDNEHGCKINNILFLYYNMNTKIEDFFNEKSLPVHLLCYYNHPKLKEICLSRSVDEEVAVKAESLPGVPHLLELSRNVVREFIKRRYNIKNSMQFYTILNWLPIDNVTKSILRLEKKLY